MLQTYRHMISRDAISRLATLSAADVHARLERGPMLRA